MVDQSLRDAPQDANEAQSQIHWLVSQLHCVVSFIALLIVLTLF